MKITYYISKTAYGCYKFEESELAKTMREYLAALKRNFPRDDVSVELTDGKERAHVSFPDEENGNRKHKTLKKSIERKVDQIVYKVLDNRRF